jgi:hypothetical protein
MKLASEGSVMLKGIEDVVGKSVKAAGVFGEVEYTPVEFETTPRAARGASVGPEETRTVDMEDVVMEGA